MAHCWPMLSLLSTITPKSFSSELLFIHSSPSMYLYPVLLCSWCRPQHFPLMKFNFMLLMIVQCWNLSTCICKTSHSSRASTTHSSLVLSANLLRMYSTPTSRSLIKMLDWNDPRIEPWGTLLVPAQHSPVSCNPLGLAI